jgi:hypothetical protein
MPDINKMNRLLRMMQLADRLNKIVAELNERKQEFLLKNNS